MSTTNPICELNTIPIRTEIPCTGVTGCNATGRIVCPECNGTGQIQVSPKHSQNTINAAILRIGHMPRCRTCGGEAAVNFGGKMLTTIPHPRCHGEGRFIIESITRGPHTSSGIACDSGTICITCRKCISS